MSEDWIDILSRGNYEVSLPTVTVTSGEVGTLTGSGQISWNADAGVRIKAVTDGGDRLTTLFFGGMGIPGRLIPDSTLVTFHGRTQQGWELRTDPMPRDGHSTDTNLPSVVWDLGTSGITLQRESSVPLGRSLRILMGPPPPQWVRMTKTEVRNDAFSSRSSNRDWLTATCRHGQVWARQRTADWFEVQVLPNAGEPMRETNVVCTAIARAFGFILGRRCVVRGYEEINETTETRRLDSRSPRTTRNTLLLPLGVQHEFMDNVEQLLGRATDFFLTELGERVASYLHLCWDTADNSHQTQLAISSICVEGLLRVAAETMGPRQPQIDEADLATFRTWIESQTTRLSQQFLKRLKGLSGMLRTLSANEIFRDWISRGVLGVTSDDFGAWRETRNPAVHGQLTAAGSHNELQTRVFRHDRVQNLLNKIVLQLMGYKGTYIDYAQSGYRPAEFPGFSGQVEASGKETSPLS